MSALLISAAHKSSGKTTVSLGLCAALRARGHVVQPFKKGPDYIDPMWLGRAAGRGCHSLDFHTSSRDEILEIYARHSSGADIAVIEGNKGLYDGMDVEGSNSNAAMARLLGTPVVLVIDTQGMTRGIAPLILGYQAFDPDTRIAGVILNKVGGSRHEAKLRAVVERYTDVPVLGAVHRRAELEIVERHLGLIPSNEDEASAARIGQIAEIVGQSVDLDRLLETAGGAAAAPRPAPTTRFRHRQDLRIGVARDAAFGFYYPGDLQALQDAGAQLITIDTLHDQRLPAIDGLFIGGGFPETQMEALERNAALRRAIREAIEAGLPTYAECGGLIYLSRSLRWRDRRCDMVGAIPADTVMHERPQGRGYVRLQSTGQAPWTVAAQGEIRAHEFHYSSLVDIDPGLEYAYEVKRGTGVDGHRDGIVYRNLLASYTHLRDTAHTPWARRFVKYVRAHRQKRLAAEDSTRARLETTPPAPTLQGVSTR